MSSTQITVLSVLCGLALGGALLYLDHLRAGAEGLDPTQVELVRHELPRAQIDLPDWVVGEQGTEFHSGAVRVDAPGGRGRFVELRWAATSEPLGEAELMALTRDASGLEPTRRGAVEVHGHAGFSFTAEGDGKRSAWSVWYCPEDRRMLHLVCFLDLDAEPLWALHERIRDTTKCHEGAAPGPVAYPRFDPPADFHPIESAPARTWGKGDQAIAFLPSVPADTVLPIVEERPGFEAAVLRATLAADVERELGPEKHTGPDGHLRHLWTYRVDAAGDEGRALFMLLECPGERVFMGLWSGPPGADTAPARALLFTATCP